MIDENLTWHSQVDLITKKVNKSFYFLRQLPEFAELKTLLCHRKETLRQDYVRLHVTLHLRMQYARKSHEMLQTDYTCVYI